MRIILGAALLAIAFAAPIKDEDNEHPSYPDFPEFPSFPSFPAVSFPEVTTPEPMEPETVEPTTVPSVAHVSAGLEKLFDASTAFPTYIREDVPTTSASPEISHEEYNAKLIEYEQEVRKLLSEQGIPEEAIEEYFDAKFHLFPFDDEKKVRFLQFFEKWAPKQSRETTVEPETTDATMSDEEHNAAAIKGEDEIRATLRKSGVPEEAISEFIEQEFHLLPFSMEKYFDLHAWGRRWGLEQVSKFRWTAKDGGRLYVAPEETWKVDVSEPEAQKVRENNQKVREVFGRMGLPEEAIDEFIALGLTEEPHDEKKQELAMEWMTKWQFSFPAARQMHDIGKELADEVATIFMHAYMGVSVMQAFNMEYYENGVMAQEKMNAYKEVMSHLTQFEHLLIQSVLDTVAKKIVKKYGINIHGEGFERAIEKYGKEITDEVATTFLHTNMVTSAMQSFQLEFTDGVMTQERLHFFKEVFSHLTDYEQALVKKVMETVAKKIVKKYEIIDGKGIERY